MRRVGSVGVVAIVSSLVFAAGAFAAVVGLELRTAHGPLDSAASKSATAVCPAGKQVTGAAAIKTHSAFGEVRLLAARPASDLKSVISTFREDENGFAGNWQPTAHALCVAPLTGMQRITATSASNSVAKSVTATCPTGKRLIGLGAETAGGSGQVGVDVIRPNQGLTAAVVTAREDQNGFAGNWTVSAYAVCAVAPQGLQRVSAAGQVTPNGPDVVADCPAGKGLLGVGGEASGGSGQVAIETYPLLADTSEPTRGVARAFEDQDGYTPAWTLTAYAICANSALLAVAQSPTNSSVNRFADAFCPSGKSATGGGADITGGLGQVHLTRAVPAFNLSNFSTDAYEDVNGFAGNWSQRGYAVCGTPLAGLEVVAATGFDLTGALVGCPTGKKVVGAGGEVSATGLSDVFLEDLRPNASLTVVTVVPRVAEGGTGAGGNTNAFALCANPPPGLQLVSARDPDADSEEIKVVSATCPAGKYLLGAGGEIDPGGFGQVVLDDLRPDQGLKKVTVTAIEDETGYSGTWFPRAHAICANY